MRSARLAVPLVATVAALLGAPAGAQVPGVAVDGEACSDGVGVTVVVDFQELGDDTVVVRCATGTDAPADGFAALDRAAVPYRTTIAFPGFLCRLFDQPADDPCDTASPADAYWSYWLAPAGGEWCYSNKGAANRTPPVGSVEGWSFSLDKGSDAVPPPRFDPPPAPAGVEPRPLAPEDCTTPAPSSATEPEGTSDRRRGEPVDLGPEQGGGSPVGLAAGAVGVVVLVSAAFVVARRRRDGPVDGTDPDVVDPGAERWRSEPAPSEPEVSGDDDDGWSAAIGRPLGPDDEMWARPDEGSSEPR